jgi:hypothetical protein
MHGSRTQAFIAETHEVGGWGCGRGQGKSYVKVKFDTIPVVIDVYASSKF